MKKDNLKLTGEIIADQPEEIIDKFQFWAFLKLYTDLYGEKLKEDCFGDFENV